MKTIYGWAPLALLAVGACSAPEKTERPNVLFISVDDLNDWIGVLGGHPQVKTPNMDRLFRSGVTFTNAHASQAVSTASRASLMSGLHPASTGWYANTPTYRVNFEEVMAGNYMLPEYFRKNGYRTMAAGKVFHGGLTDMPGAEQQYWTETAPLFWKNVTPQMIKDATGFRAQMYYPFPAGGGQFVEAYGAEHILNYVPEKGSIQRFYALCGGPLSEDQLPENGMFDEQIAAWAVDRLKETHEQPFFLAVGFIRPHVPYTAPQEFFDLYDPDTLILPEIPEHEMADIPLYGKAIAWGASDAGDWYDVQRIPGMYRELVHAYLACISFVDAQIGKVLDALEESGQSENTIIVLFGDHGQHLGEKHHFRKQSLWEEATHVPLCIRIPGHSDVGKRCAAPVSLLDLYPTLVEACHLAPNPANQGTSLVSLVEDVFAVKENPAVMCWDYGNFAVRSENWRYIRYRDGSEELYDHRTDPEEHVNLAGNPDFQEVIAWHRNYVPEHPALPSYMEVWQGDKYDRMVREWQEKPVPDWLD